MKIKVRLKIIETGIVDVPEEVVQQGDDAIEDYLYQSTGNPWGVLELLDSKTNTFDITFAKEEDKINE